jgi:uncharacterized metal-binding protein YceD (DUF177 family)
MKKIQEIDNFDHVVSLEHLKRELEYKFSLICSKPSLNKLSDSLNLIEAKKAAFNGILKLQTENKIILEGRVTAKLIQACSLTLDPVITNISKKVQRSFSVGSESDVSKKKNIFELTKKCFDNDVILDRINLGDVLMETISLETPDYPKKSGATLHLLPKAEYNRENPFSILSKLKK